MLDALESTPRADPAVLTHHAIGADDPARTVRARVGRGTGGHPSRCAHPGGRVLPPRPRPRASPVAPDEEAELLELLGVELLPRRPAPGRHRRQRAGHAVCGSGPPTPPGSAATTTPCRCTSGTTPNRDVADRHASAAVAVVDGDRRRARRRRARLARPRAGACRRTWPCRPTTSTAPARCLALAGRVAAGIDEPTLAVRLRIIGGICDVIEGRGAARDATLSVLGSCGRGHCRRDLLERLQQPDLPRRRAAALRRRLRPARVQPPAHDRARPADLPRVAARIAGPAAPPVGATGTSPRRRRRGAGRATRPVRAHLAAPGPRPRGPAPGRGPGGRGRRRARRRPGPRRRRGGWRSASASPSGCSRRRPPSSSGRG